MRLGVNERLLRASEGINAIHGRGEFRQGNTDIRNSTLMNRNVRWEFTGRLLWVEQRVTNFEEK